MGSCLGKLREHPGIKARPSLPEAGINKSEECEQKLFSSVQRDAPATAES